MTESAAPSLPPEPRRLLLVTGLAGAGKSTVLDVLPIAAIIFGFQFLVIRKPIPHLKRTLLGFAYVLVGLALFLIGLEQALFPLGKMMAHQLTDPAFVSGAENASRLTGWLDYKWVYLFAFAIGFSTTVAEPSLIAVAIKAREVSGGAIGVWGLRSAVAVGGQLGAAQTKTQGALIFGAEQRFAAVQRRRCG